MEVGTEISQKIRSAIKAKLMELGAYVDDELPDYIMVMVANKKNISQMKADLSLFLGGNTETFTSWLHGLLGKLQTITVESSKDKNDKPKSSKDKKKDKGSGQKSKNDSTKGKKAGKEKSRKRKSSRDGVEDAPKAKVAVSNTVENENSESQSQNPDIAQASPNQEPNKCAKVSEMQLSQELKSSRVTENEPQANEASNAKQASVQEEIEDVRQLLVASTPGDELAQELDAAEEEVSSVVKTSSRSTNVSTKVSLNKTADISLESHSHREQKVKRKVPSSVVASVSRGEDEEEYDPFNPAVGSVASVVKVTSRKTAFPQSMQANRQSGTADDPEHSVEADKESPVDGIQAEDCQRRTHIPSQIVDLEVVKQALSDVLEKFQYNGRQDEVGSFTRSLERVLRKFEHRAFLQVRSQIFQLLSNFDSESCGSSLQDLSSTSENSIVRKETTRVKNPSNVSNVENGDVLHNTAKTAANDKSHVPDRIIFSSKSGKSPMLTSSEHGSEYYRNFVSSILRPAPQKPGTDQSLSDGNSACSGTGSNTPTQTLVSSTRLETDSSPKAGLASSSASSLRSKASFVSLSQLSASSSKLTHSPSPSSTSSPSLPLAQNAAMPKASVADPGFHRLRSQILVDSLHARRKPDSGSLSANPPTPSLLQHAWRRRQTGDNKDDGDPLALFGEGGSNSPSSQSPQHYSGEALKVLAKNLRVTIINRQAKGVESSSTGDESSSDDDDDDDSEEDSSDGDQGAEEGNDIDEKADQSPSNEKLSVL